MCGELCCICCVHGALATSLAGGKGLTGSVASVILEMVLSTEAPPLSPQLFWLLVGFVGLGCLVWLLVKRGVFYG